MSRARAVKERARELGFDKVGIARAGPAPRGEFLAAWLERGFHGTMEFMARGAGPRRDPSLLLPGVRSVICVAKSYGVPAAPPDDPMRGRVSRHALGEDYHLALAVRLVELARFVESMGGRASAFADSGPVMEKPWAEMAGLGWQGKNSLLVSRQFGSWIVLGEVLTDLELEADPPAVDACGECDLCLKRCPGGAIVAPGVVDARRCISYLTIELKGPIPRGLRPLLGNRIFGCDACQEICPCNGAFMDPGGGTGEASPPLAVLMGLRQDEFMERFGGRAQGRTGYARFLRNVAVALGNSGDPAAVPPLEGALGHPEPLVRMHAAWALGRLGAAAALERRRRAEADAAVRAEIEDALAGRP